ncbi:MAG: oxygen-dependent coproporphyrinogen oxidase [Bacteroidetes bacterium]|nr:oxygen-dependent coproporphyrinogen oxidase [Bacteroidota bacterium]
MKAEAANYFRNLQDTICKGLEELDGSATFQEDVWTREGGGGGRTRVIQQGTVFEKGGVNFSEVFGNAPEFLSKEAGDNKAKTFFATGVSLVIHPQSPMVPIIHMNVRYLQLETKEWFGGGIDLTPIYIEEADANYFHQTLKATCSRFHPSFYPEFKKRADDYFFIPHRNETRGIGGIFFDHMGRDESQLKIPLGQFFEFVMAVGNIFLPIYMHLVRKNKDKPFAEKEKQWQLLRRGRYAEFNLVYDRGTKFGLETNGRTESILMSLPPEATWLYDFIPEKNSAEEKTSSLLKKGMEWAD